MLEKYPGDVKVVFKNFPLRRHKFAYKAALASLAAHRQGRFWDFHDHLFKNYNRLNDQKIQEISVQLGLDQEKFQEDMDDPRIRAMVQQDMAEGARAGVRGTPTVFLNGRPFKNLNFQTIQAAVERALEKIERAAKAGAGEKE